MIQQNDDIKCGEYYVWYVLDTEKTNDWNGINSKNTAGILIQFTQFQYFVCSICAFDLIKGKQWRLSKEKKNYAIMNSQ